MKHIKRHGVDLVMGLGLVVFCGASQGLGLGHGGSHVTMGEGLSFTVPVRLEPGEHLEDGCLAADVYFGDDKVSDFKVSVTLSKDGLGASVVHVATTSAVNEPVVTVSVAAGCFARVTRKYVVLADPPVLTMPFAAPEAQDVALAPADAPAALPADLPSAGKTKRSGKAHKRHAGAHRSARYASATKATAASPSHENDGARASRQRLPEVSEVARLQLDPAAADALVSPNLRMGSTLSMPAALDDDNPVLQARRASATAYWRALQATPEQLSKDQARLADLAQRVAELQALREQAASARRAAVATATPTAASSAAAQQLASHELDVQHIRIMGLIGVGLFGVAGYGYLYWRGRGWRGREVDVKVDKDWWQGWMGGTLPASAEPVQGVGGLRHPKAPSSDSLSDHLTMDTVSPATDFLPALDQAAAQLHGIATSLGARDVAPQRRATVDELVDLAQQAELFVVLGQDDATQDLLEQHVRQTKGGSPWPFLALLEIYHRRKQRPDYERTEQALDARFKGRAPGWAQAELLRGRPLEAHAMVFAQLQAAWPQPEQAVALLEKLICPPDGAAEQARDEDFGLTAYRSLLSLHAVARDAVERRPGSGPQNAMPALHEVLANTEAAVA